MNAVLVVLEVAAAVVLTFGVGLAASGLMLQWRYADSLPVGSSALWSKFRRLGTIASAMSLAVLALTSVLS